MPCTVNSWDLGITNSVLGYKCTYGGFMFVTCWKGSVHPPKYKFHLLVYYTWDDPSFIWETMKPETPEVKQWFAS